MIKSIDSVVSSFFKESPPVNESVLFYRRLDGGARIG